jgi:hypothetical protein
MIDHSCFRLCWRRSGGGGPSLSPLDRSQKMTKALLVARVRVEDAGAFSFYTESVQSIIARHGGRFICRGGNVTTLEGSEENAG